MVVVWRMGNHLSQSLYLQLQVKIEERISSVDFVDLECEMENDIRLGMYVIDVCWCIDYATCWGTIAPIRLTKFCNEPGVSRNLIGSNYTLSYNNGALSVFCSIFRDSALWCSNCTMLKPPRLVHLFGAKLLQPALPLVTLSSWLVYEFCVALPLQS